MPADAAGPVETRTDSATGRALPAFAIRPVAMVAAVPFVLLVAVIGRYGYFRDELYFIDASKHLAWGYDDQPPLTPAIVWLERMLFGESVIAIRIAPTLFAVGLVLLCALIARELGGGARAQTIAALCLAPTPLVLLPGHIFTTATVNYFFFALLSWLVVRWLRSGEDRLWLVIGPVAGLGLLNNGLVAVLAAAMLPAAIVAGRQRILVCRWFWAGVALAAIPWTPYLLWQQRHDWPQLAMAEYISGQNVWVELVPAQLQSTLFVAPVWMIGLYQLFRSQRLRPYRMVGLTYLVFVALILLTGGRPYYIGGLYPVLFAAGALPVAGWLGDRTLRPARLATVVGAAAATALIAVPVALPVLPARVLADTPLPSLNRYVADTYGWPELVGTVAAVHAALPPGERERTVVVAGNYAIAGAINLLGPAHGLPAAYAPHRGAYRWGPPPELGGPVILVGFTDPPGEHWQEVQVVAEIDNGLDLASLEQGGQVVLGRGQLTGWAELWPALLAYHEHP